MLYNIDVQIFFPPTMPTPGYATEELTRPAIVKKIEESDDGLTPEQAALALFKGAERGDAHITGDILASLFRAGTRGAAHRSNRGLGVGVGWIIDGVLDFVAFVSVVRNLYQGQLANALVDRCACVEVGC
jgi:3-dehydrosphinganine reductase